MKDAKQLKDLSKSLAASKNISMDVILHTYMMERLLERIYKSKYKNNFIIKGGVLIASIFGLETRSTVDIDAVIKSYPLTTETITRAFEDITKVDLGDGVSFEIFNIKTIRESHIYQGYRIVFKISFDGITVFVKTDVSAGDRVIPKEILYQYPLILEDRTIEISAYNVETILAEKLETIISRSILNTRMKDFYDVYMLMRYRLDKVDRNILLEAINTVFKNRDTHHLLPDVQSIASEIIEDVTIQERWKAYCKKYPYAKNLSWQEASSSLAELSNMII